MIRWRKRPPNDARYTVITIQKNYYSFHHTVDIPQSKGFHRHMHNGYEILYFLKGDAEYIIEGSVYRLSPRDLLFIKPRSFHYLKPLSDAVSERFILNFPEERIPPALLPFCEEAREIYRVPRGSLPDLFFEAWSMAELDFPKEELRTYLDTALSSILLYLRHLPEEETVEPIRENRTLEAILRYVDEHPSEPLTAQLLSAKFYMSTSWIIHTFKKNLGISLMQYVGKKRILYAEEQLRLGKTPTEVAKLCHFDSYSTFYRQYKKILGHAPQEDHARHTD